MESTKRIQVIVGAFIFFGLVVILGTIFTLGADKALFKSYARLNAHFDQVQGLAEGSVVSLSGIVVGNVEEIGFSNEAKNLNITLKIEEKYLERITKGSQVEIRTQGALGDKFVFIIPGPRDEAPMKDGDILEVAKATDILGIMSERGQETERVFDIILELHKMVKTINDGEKLGLILNNMAEASANLNASTSEAKRITAGLAQGSPELRLNRSLEKFENIVDKIDRGQGSLGALINDPTVHERLKTLLGTTSPRKNAVKDLLRTSIEKSDK